MSVLDFTSNEPICFAAKWKIRTHPIWPLWGLMSVSCRERVMKRPHHCISNRRGLYRISWCILPSEGYPQADQFIISHELGDIIGDHLPGSFKWVSYFSNIASRPKVPGYVMLSRSWNYCSIQGFYFETEHRSRSVLIRTSFQRGVSLSSATKQRFSSWQKKICHSGQR